MIDMKKPSEDNRPWGCGKCGVQWVYWYSSLDFAFVETLAGVFKTFNSERDVEIISSGMSGTFPYLVMTEQTYAEFEDFERAAERLGKL